ncbi:cyclin-like protein [Poronia punctata]|nr:cyclin-like protein [Poronia punctata]
MDSPFEESSGANGSSHNGPSIGEVRSGTQYLHEVTIRRKRRLPFDIAQEDAARVQGVQLIDEVRNALQLPITTYMAACLFYHQFRLHYPGDGYIFSDVALTCLFVACKSEDTLKKSREILCAHHNLKNPDRITTPDDKLFDAGSKQLIGLERHVIESVRFDFQVRNPVKMLAKIIKAVLGSGPEASDFFLLGYRIATDMYKTLAPLKHTTFTCAISLAILSSMISGNFRDTFDSLNPTDYYTRQEWVAEVMLDILDLYTDHHRSTLLGQEMDIQLFINIKIEINRRVEEAKIHRYQNFCKDCEREGFSPPPSSPGSPTSSKRGPRGFFEGTARFLFDASEVEHEKAIFGRYKEDQWEVWEEEVEELIPERESHIRADLGPEPRPPPREPRAPRAPRGHGHPRGRGRGLGGRGGHDPGWHPRNRHGRGRGGGL